MNRVNAKEICAHNGVVIGKNFNMATRNKATHTYWANPSIACLQQDWWLLLHDDRKNELHVFMIPSNSISTSAVKIRSDVSKPNHIRIEIRYDDNSFEDTKSKIEFLPWHIKTLRLSYAEMLNEIVAEETKEYKNDYKTAKMLSNKDLESKVTEKYSINKDKKTTRQSTYIRNAYISEYAKRLADGVCQLCGNPAPFNNADNEPYLEIHHIEWLSRGGLDIIDNVTALCPNCHRKMHILDNKDDIDYLIEIPKKLCN